MRMLTAAALLASVAAPAMAQTHTTVTRTTRPGVVVTTHQGYAPPVYVGAPAAPDGPYLPYDPLPSDAEVFGGVRIEAQLGFDRIGGDDQVIFGSRGGGRNGFSYGAEAGFDIPLGETLLVGGYAGFEGSTVKDCASLVGATSCAKAPYSLMLGGRIGAVVSPGTLIYAKGGYTRGRIEYDSTRVTLPPVTIAARENLDGFHAGGGIERQFSRNAYGKIEYVYTRLRGFDALALPTAADDAFDRHQVKLGLGLRL